MMSTAKKSILDQIDVARLPRHVAIIMDGNGRWAKKRRMPRLFGHQAGSRTVREIVETAGRLGIKHLTLYAFSTENWSRPQTEISGLMRLLQQTLRKEVKNLDQNNVRLSTIGNIKQLPSPVQDELNRSIQFLSKNTGLHLILALNYGARQDIVQSVNQLIKEGRTSISEEDISGRLYTAGVPDPDLLIRTSGEMRISNFLLWQIAYSELYVTPVLWPDFKSNHFYQAILDYQERERRFGALH